MAKSIFETTITAPVYFMIGSQRSGSNWLRTMLSEREDLIAPHPPHIMRDFMPLLPKYGDLDDFSNLKVSEVKIVTWFAILVYPAPCRVVPIFVALSSISFYWDSRDLILWR